jgi:ATPase subunit of ABC transporter with duplicated ATPase domains
MRRILIAGTTGARKTTLLRHIIGSSHKSDRFPSTSTARTTIADTEVVTYDGPVEAAITFMSQLKFAHISKSASKFGEQHRSEWMSAYAFSGTGSVCGARARSSHLRAQCSGLAFRDLVSEVETKWKHRVVV